MDRQAWQATVPRSHLLLLLGLVVSFDTHGEMNLLSGDIPSGQEESLCPLGPEEGGACSAPKDSPICGRGPSPSTDTC